MRPDINALIPYDFTVRWWDEETRQNGATTRQIAATRDTWATWAERAQKLVRA